MGATRSQNLIPTGKSTMATEPTPAPPAPPAPLPTEIPSGPEDRTMAVICHVGGILTAPLLPGLIWLLKKDESRFVDDQGKEALNFQITLLIGYFVGFILSFIVIGAFIIIGLWIYS